MRVVNFMWVEDVEEHIAAHGIRSFEVDQILSNRHLVVPNRKTTRPNRMFVIGQADSGRILTVVIEKTREAGTWLVVTAWDSDQTHRDKLRGAK